MRELGYRWAPVGGLRRRLYVWLRRRLYSLRHWRGIARLRRRRTMEGLVAHLARQGFAPAAVVDVGAGAGTPALYQFPRARYLLVEPLVEHEPALRRLCQQLQAQYTLVAAGDRRGQTELFVHADLVGSSTRRETDGPLVDGTPRQVPVATLDEIYAEHDLSGPLLLKIDVQGGELDVLRGASEVLNQTEVALLEVSLFEFCDGGPQLPEVLDAMAARGFVPYDVCDPLYRPLDGALAQLDVAFVKREGLFRRSHRFTGPDQRDPQGNPIDVLLPPESIFS